MVDGFTVLVRLVRGWRDRGQSSREIVDALVVSGVCTPEYAFLITRAVAVDTYMTTLDVLLTSPDPPLEDLALGCPLDE